MNRVKIKLLDEDAMRRTITRLAHEIIENNSNTNNIAIVGIRTRGEFLAKRIASCIKEITGDLMDVGTIDVTFYRDDFRTNLGSPKVGTSDILFEVDEKTIILIDDVLYTGRTIRAAMDDLFSFGRPQAIQLGVLVDRGHRELPIRADFVGKNYQRQIHQPKDHLM